MGQGEEVDFSHEKDRNGWLEKEKNSRVFQGARGKIATTMTPEHEAQPSGYGAFLIYLHKVSKAVVTANTPYPHVSHRQTHSLITDALFLERLRFYLNMRTAQTTIRVP